MGAVLMDDDGVVGETVASSVEGTSFHTTGKCTKFHQPPQSRPHQGAGWCHREILLNPCTVGAVALLAFDRRVYSFRKRLNTR